VIFSAIENTVLSGNADLGVIIHENRFTYQQRGLHKVTELGEYWETRMKAPIPLGGIAIKRKIDPGVAVTINKLIRKSLDYSFSTYPAISAYVSSHSQEMNEEVMRQHIELYVNNYSLDLGTDGKKAIKVLHRVYTELNPGGEHPVTGARGLFFDE
jgi:1,4-dihydroxy-6-naphthoate synthase